MHNSINKVVIVLNRRFVPKNRKAGYIYGVVQHVLQMAEIFQARNINVSFLLYNRDQRLTTPIVDRCQILGYEASIISFNFGMSFDGLIEVFSGEANFLNGHDSNSIIYSQSVAIADFFCTSLPLVVTNHSPFVASVFEAIGTEHGRMAFDWDHPKADFLLNRQSEVLQKLVERSNITFAEISNIQTSFLKSRGFSESQVLDLPPVVGSELKADVSLLPTDLMSLPVQGGQRYALFPVSRFDYFKDVEFFLDGITDLIKSSAFAGAILIGGEVEDPEYSRIEQQMDNTIRGQVVRLPRQAHNVLIQGVFPWIAEHGIVACTSRYDLVPYTMLEAILSGAQVVVPNSGFVGAAGFVPKHWTYKRAHQHFHQAISFKASKDEIRRVKADISRKVASKNILDVFLMAAERSIKATR